MTYKNKVAKSLASRSYVATDQNIQRAYWRFAKLRHGIDTKHFRSIETIADYLINNNQVTSIQNA